MVLEYHVAPKCPAIEALELPIPCPSGDQRLLSRAERHEHRADAHAAAAAAGRATTPHAEGAAASDEREGHLGAADSAPPTPTRAEHRCVSWLDASAAAAAPPPALVKVPAAAGASRVVSVDGRRAAAAAAAAEALPTYEAAAPRALRAGAQALAVGADCAARWRRYTHDVLPLDGNSLWLGDGTQRHGVCTHGGRMGVVPSSGEHAGTCVLAAAGTESVAVVYGGFDGLLIDVNDAAAAAPVAPRAAASAGRGGASAAARLLALARTHLSAADEALFAAACGGHTVGALLAVLKGSSADLADDLAADLAGDLAGDLLAEQLMSTVRFVPHALNAIGLHPFRVLLAERLTDAARDASARAADEVPASLRAAWQRDGLLRLDFGRYTAKRGEGNERLAQLLRMLSAGAPPPTEPLRWAARTVVHEEGDPQYQPHVDTYHTAIKIWVYEENVTAADGPLHVAVGTHRATQSKLAWLYARTRHNAPAVVSEPSIRLTDDAALPRHGWDEKLVAAQLPKLTAVLPLPGVARTLVIADTSALHCRGAAKAGARRSALRPQGLAADGGVARRNPFEPIG